MLFRIITGVLFILLIIGVAPNFADDNYNISIDDLLEENDHILNQNPDNLTAWEFRALIYYNNGRYLEAINASEHCLSISPEDEFAWHIIGSSWGNLGEFSKSSDAFQKAIEINPNDPTEYNVRGVALSRMENFQEAVSSFEKALNLDQSYATAWNNLGVTYYEMGEPKKAAEAFSRAIALKRDEPVFYSNKGFALIDLNNYSEAKSNAKTARQLDMTNVPSWFVSGEAEFHEKNCNDAFYAFDGGFSTLEKNDLWYYQGGKSIQISKDMEPVDAYYISVANNVKFTGLWDRTRVIEYKIKRYQNTLDVYDQIMAITPDYGNGWKKKGYCGIKLEKFESSRDAYKMALEFFPNDPDSLASYGYSLGKLGDYLGAMTYINKAMELEPEFARGYYLKADIHDMYGEKEEAVRSYQKALETDPHNPEILTAYSTLLWDTGDWLGSVIHFFRGSIGF